MPALIRFGDFEFDPASGELSRRGRNVRLQPQPAKVLALLVDRAGDTVTREEIRQLLWNGSIHVEFDQSINFCIHQLRTALHDSAERPIWIETLPKRGYRFQPLVIRETASAPPPAEVVEAAAIPPGSAESDDRPRVSVHRVALLAAIFAILALASLFVAGRFDAALRDERTATTPGFAAVATRLALPAAALPAYQRGLYLARRDGAESIARGIRELRFALELAPDSAEPRVALAEALLAMHCLRPAEALLGEAEQLATAAVRLAPGSARAHLARANALLAARYDWSGAESEYRQALALDDALAEAHRGYAALLAAEARFPEAIAAARRARELDPVCLAASSDLGWYYFLAGRFDEAIAASREALTLDPRNTSAHLTILYSHLEQGDEAAALATANAHLRAYFAALERPAPQVASLASYWRGYVDHLSAASADSAPSDLAVPQLSLGDDAEAMRLLLRGCREHTGRDAKFAAVNPMLQPWRNDPRLQQVIDCVGLEPQRSS